jgi:hypothetical protein
MVFPVSAPHGKPQTAQVERTDSTRTAAPSTRTAAPQSPAADPVAQTPVVTLARGGAMLRLQVWIQNRRLQPARIQTARALRQRVSEMVSRGSVAVSTSTQTDSASLTVPVATAHAKGSTNLKADVPAASSVDSQGAFDRVIPIAQGRAYRQPGTPVLPVKLFALHKSHQGCCSMRECGQCEPI